MRTAVLIPCHDEAPTIAETVSDCRPLRRRTSSPPRWTGRVRDVDQPIAVWSPGMGERACSARYSS